MPRSHLVDERCEPREVDRTVAAVEIPLRRARTARARAARAARDSPRDLEPHRRAELALPQLALQRLAQVLDFLLVDPQVGVARDAELRVAAHLAPREELRQVRGMTDDSMTNALSPPPSSLGIADHAPQHARRLHDRDRRFAAERVAAAEVDDEVERLARDLRKRMRWIESDRGQQAAAPRDEKSLPPLALVPL